MKQFIIKPSGRPCRLDECGPGLFCFKTECGPGLLCFKTEYGTEPPYIIESGEIFLGGAHTDEERNTLIVQPCIAVWED